MDQPFVVGSVSSGEREIPQIRSDWTYSDRFGAVKTRWAVGRMRYAVVPGLYALGDPDPSSPVLVSANYKLSFDHLRRAAKGLDSWVLVLDTLGINVWCAAGKGTFGTDELVMQIESVQLATVVNHRKIIVPQLGAPGVAAHLVAKRSKFRVIWGPVLAEDLPAFLDADCRATAEMRRKRFQIRERATLIPVELVATIKPLAVVLPIAIALAGFGGGGNGYLDRVLTGGSMAVLAILAGVIAGAALTPLVLPWLPGRAFSLKGAVAGLPIVLGALFLGVDLPVILGNRLEFISWLLIGTSVSAFLAMNFTGASTFTSLSGVRREMKLAVPAQILVTIFGLCLGLAGRLME